MVEAWVVSEAGICVNVLGDIVELDLTILSLVAIRIILQIDGNIGSEDALVASAS